MKNLAKTKLFQRWVAGLSIMIFCVASTQAQDPPNAQAQYLSNDATWEETIAFIEENIGYITPVDRNSGTLSYSYRLLISLDKIMEVEIVRRDQDNQFFKVRANMARLRSLQRVAVTKYNSISLKFPKGSVDENDFLTLDERGQKIAKRAASEDSSIEELENSLAPYHEWNSDVMSFMFFPINDAEMGKRLMKAFQHLAYLANNEE